MWLLLQVVVVLNTIKVLTEMTYYQTGVKWFLCSAPFGIQIWNKITISMFYFCSCLQQQFCDLRQVLKAIVKLSAKALICMLVVCGPQQEELLP